jgi:hypothetical protein
MGTTKQTALEHSSSSLCTIFGSDHPFLIMMRDLLNQLGRVATRIVTAAFCAAAVLSCGGGDTSSPGPTQIVAQPQNQTVAAGSTATFSVQLAGQAPAVIFWTKGGVSIAGSTALTYTTPPTVPSDDGLTFGVRLAVQDAGGFMRFIDSAMATLTVTPAVPAVAGTFKAAGGLVKARSGHTATLLPSGMVLIVGGQQPGGPPTAAMGTSVELYDPATDTFTLVGSISAARSGGHTATLLDNGKVLLCGGIDASVNDGRADAEIYDPATGASTATGPMGTRRFGHAAVLLRSGKVLIAGGVRGDGLSAELFDPVTGTFSPTSSMVHYRYGVAGVLLADGNALIFGYDDRGDLYDPVKAAFAATGSSQVAGGLWWGPAMALLADGRVLVVGGKEQGTPPSNLALVGSARLFDPATSGFALTGALIWPRAGNTATRLTDGRVLVFGGEGDGRWPERGEIYDPRAGSFAATVSAGAGRSGHTATLLQSGKVLIAGGQAGTSQVAASSAAGSLLFDPM